MDYQLALPPNLNPADFVAAWNDNPACRTAAEARLAVLPPAQFDPTLTGAAAVLSAVALGVASNALYDLIKAVLIQQGVRRQTEIVELQQPDGTRVLVVKIAEEKSRAIYSMEFTMPEELAAMTERDLMQRQGEWRTPLPRLEEIIHNAPYVKKILEERQLALMRKNELERDARDLNDQIYNLKLYNQRLQMRVSYLIERSKTMIVLSVLSSILIGIGANLVTSFPGNWVGWVLIATGSILETMALWTGLQKND